MTPEGANEPFTDQDGWIYGDNKWENQSSKGGIGKVSLRSFLDLLLPADAVRTVYAIQTVDTRRSSCRVCTSR